MVNKLALMKRSIIFFLVIFSVVIAHGQSDVASKAKKPNLPGIFLIDFGFNGTVKAPGTFKHGFWGSRTANIYYQYPIRIGRSKFSFNPGIGLSLERWKFKDGAALMDTVELVSYPNGAPSATQVEQYNLVNPLRLYPKQLSKSMLVTNFFEIPIEFRFDTKPEDISRSINVALGGRVGFLYDAFTKVKYNDLGEEIKVKNKMNHGVNPFRYGVYARFGIGSFSFFTFYNLSDMFEKGKGPMGTTMNTFTTGISINGF
jgi:hypothetical protein